MDLIHNIDTVYEHIGLIKNNSKQSITNFYPNNEKIKKWIDKKLFYKIFLTDTFFLIRKDRDFYHLYYYSKDINSLQSALKVLNNNYTNEIFVIDVLGEKIFLEKINEIFVNNGFNKYILYIRMFKFINHNDSLPKINEDVILAQLSDSKEIFQLFESEFDRFAEQIPTIVEIEELIESNEVLLIKINNDIAGILIRKNKIYSSLWSFFLVNKKYRNQKIGSKLLSYYFNECKGKKINMWVLSNNNNAISIYKHYGFDIDKLFNQIYINKNLNYETKSN